jgi:CheY-like chemotaxis protein
VKILVVDDNPTDVEWVRAMARGLDVKIVTADSTAEAVSHLPVDLILLDHNLPGTSGLEWLKQLRQDDSWCHIPVVIISGASTSSLEIAAYECGARAWAIKPITQETLQRLIA